MIFHCGRRVVVSVPGEPVPQGRPRFTTRGGFPRAYDPPKSRAWKAAARAIFENEMKANKLKVLEGPLEVFVTATFKKPKKKKRPTYLHETETTLLHDGRGDIDNIVKAVLDAAKGVVMVDDKQVWCLRAQKFYGPRPHVSVSFEQTESSVEP